jgi:signal peptidase I
MTLLLRFKISGHSMMPLLRPGQEILVSSIPYWFKDPKAGQIIAFKDGNKFIVKRVLKVEDGKFQVSGDNKKDSKEYGWIEIDKIIGKVIYILT